MAELVTPFCSVCAGVLEPHFPEVEDSLSHEIFAIAACRTCGLGHTLPQPQDLARYYGERYYGQRHGFTDNFCAARRVRLVSRSFARDHRRGRLLDIGCGEGTFMLRAQRDGWEVYGTEINPAPARTHGLKVRSSIEEMAQDSPFDCITLWHSLEHLRQPGETIRQLHGLLAPRGSLLIAVPDAGGLHAQLFGRRWFPLDVPRHLHHFGNSSLTRMLQEAGFDVTARAHQEIEYDLFSFNISALNLLMMHPVDCFEFLMGRPRRVSWLKVAGAVLLSALLFPVTLAMTLLGSAFGRGGTIILAARRK